MKTFVVQRSIRQLGTWQRRWENDYENKTNSNNTTIITKLNKKYLKSTEVRNNLRIEQNCVAFPSWNTDTKRLAKNHENLIQSSNFMIQGKSAHETWNHRNKHWPTSSTLQKNLKITKNLKIVNIQINIIVRLWKIGTAEQQYQEVLVAPWFFGTKELDLHRQKQRIYTTEEGTVGQKVKKRTRRRCYFRLTIACPLITSKRRK